MSQSSLVLLSQSSASVGASRSRKSRSLTPVTIGMKTRSANTKPIKRVSERWSTDELVREGPLYEFGKLGLLVAPPTKVGIKIPAGRRRGCSTTISESSVTAICGWFAAADIRRGSIVVWDRSLRNERRRLQNSDGLRIEIDPARAPGDDAKATVSAPLLNTHSGHVDTPATREKASLIGPPRTRAT